jgi:hypothetical protein
MFLHILTLDQQTAFLALAKQFIAADEVLSGEEHNQLELAMAEVGWDFDEEVPEMSKEDIAKAFDTPSAQRVALLELIGIGLADQEFHPNENAFVCDMAQRWGIAEGTVPKLLSWVERQIALAREGEDLLAG